MDFFDKIRDALGLTGGGPDPAPKTRGLTPKRTVCCFCSCGCGMLGYVHGGKLISLEGDPANPINEGTLCSKGAAARELHTATERLTQPLLRPAGARDFEPIGWDAALDKAARAIKTSRDRAWKGEVRRSDGLGFLGGAVNTNEETYLYRKLSTLLGCHAIEHQARI